LIIIIIIITSRVGVSLAGAARSHIYFFSQRGIDYNWRHLIDTHTMRWEIYHAHSSQSGRRYATSRLIGCCSRL